MENTIILDDTLIPVDEYLEEKINGLRRISVKFKVTSGDYHDITTLLYKGTFLVKVSNTEESFKASIDQYSTSITNLYEKGNIGVFSLSLLEAVN
ncbi:DUF3219 family protein [Mesobacillus foraminis]|uniref:DUF3219 family protein n=1 Tax=Mesobacillus foraminis TaxID=279826 RepID=UPI001BE77A8B|nr:DUF3219 family protein [Mesobacillus foraminis]MBT2755189.1 DUF3219 family protein [Mesobacillus foraminis]